MLPVRQQKSLVPSLLAIAAALACSSASSGAQRVAVAVQPPTARLAPNASTSFSASATGAGAPAITWSVREANGGTVDASGHYSAPSTTGVFHVVAAIATDPTLYGEAVVTVETPLPPSTSPMWMMAYWPAYLWDWSQPLQFDGSALTHLAAGAVKTTASGGLTYGYGLSQLSASNTDRPAPGTATDVLRSQQVVSAARASGLKAILMIGGSDDANWPSATSATNRAAFVAKVLEVVDSAGWDGVDLDWESGINVSQFVATAQALRAARPNLVLTIPLPNYGGEAVQLSQQLSTTVDQLNVMTYDMIYGTMQGRTWYQSALYGTSAINSTTGHNCDAAISPLLAGGVPAAKIGIGIPFYGYTYTGTTATAPGQTASGFAQTSYNSSIAAKYLTHTYLWDAGTRSPALFDGKTEWIGFDDEASITEKANYAKVKGLGGGIIWTSPEGDFPIQGIRRNPLLETVKREFLARAPSPALRVSTPGVARFPSTNGSSGTVTVSGLGKAAVWFVVSTANFFSGGTGTIIDTIFDKTISGPTHGVPTSYVIEGSNGGATWSTLVSVTGNNLSHRMHVVDLTGLTQVRMRLTAPPDAAYGGNIDLSVHDLRNGSDDTWIVLGDSNAAMQQSGFGNGDAGRLGYEISLRDPTRYPIVVPGGTSQARMSDFLSTATYGIPRIRYWLQQYPGKFVALQIGSNDVGDLSQPATVAQLDTMQARMETLVKECLAQGRTVVLPRLRWMDGSRMSPVHPSMTQNIEAWHARLDAIAAKYPSVVPGPDVYTPSKDRPDLITADGVHPTLAGVQQSMGVWTDWAIANVYTVR